MKTNYLKSVAAGLFMFAAVVNGNAQQTPLFDLADDMSWSYQTNANETQSLSVVDKADAPAGLAVETDKVFKLVTNDISWDQWWWCSAAVFPEGEYPEITAENATLKFWVYSPNNKFAVFIKSNPSTPIMEYPDAPMEPNTWNLMEFDLSDKIGEAIERIEVIAYFGNSEIYFYPYFEATTPATPVTGDVEIFEEMDPSNFTFTSNVEACTTTIEDISSFSPAIPVATAKAFKVVSDERDWLFWYNGAITLHDSKEIKQGYALKAQIYSPADRVHILTKSEDGTVLATSCNYGERKIEPNQWNEITMTFLPSQVGSFLQSVEICPRMANAEVYGYFYWVNSGTSIHNIDATDRKVCVKDGQVVIEGATEMKQYNAMGQLISVSYNESIPAISGLNIIVADGQSFKVMYYE